MTANDPQEVLNWCTKHTDTYPAIDPLQFNLSGKAVVITGASKGIGRATAIAFAQAGCSKIAICARSDLSSVVEAILAGAAEAKREKPLVVAEKVDVASEEQIKSFAARVEKEFGGAVDVLLNNAGYLENWKPFAEADSAVWTKTWEININGLYLMSKHFLPQVLKSEMRTIFNTSSIGAVILGPGASAYQTTKFAVCRLSEFMANDYKDQGLVAIPVHPGSILTELASGLPKELHNQLNDTLELSAHFFVWLATERREWLSGRFISVAWDVNELLSRKEEILGENKLKFKLIL